MSSSLMTTTTNSTASTMDSTTSSNTATTTTSSSSSTSSSTSTTSTTNTTTSSSSSTSSSTSTTHNTTTRTTTSNSVSTSSNSRTTPVTTIFQTTFLTTDSNGQTFTSVVQATSTLLPDQVIPATTSTSGNKSHVKSIVGGVVGGILGLALLIFIAFFWLRYQRHKRIEKAFDGNFDPALTDKRSSTFNSVRGRLSSSDPTSGVPSIRSRGGAAGVAGTGIGEGSQLEDDDEDDGMGGRLTGTSIGGGIISPFSVHRGTSPTTPTSPRSRTSFDVPTTGADTQSRMGPISPQTTGGSMASFNPCISVYPPVDSQQGHHARRRSISNNSSSSPHPPSSFSYPTGAVKMYNNNNGYPPRSQSPSEYSQSSCSSSAVAKEREARGLLPQSSGPSNFSIANPNPNHLDPFDTGGGGIVISSQRQNYLRSGPIGPSGGGLLRRISSSSRENLPSEIPPAYNSLSVDD